MFTQSYKSDCVQETIIFVKFSNSSGFQESIVAV